MKRRVLVTGGAGGIGKALVARLENRGFEVHAPRRIDLDLSRVRAVQEFLDREGTDWDVFVHCAGENCPMVITDISDAQWSHTLQVNLGSSFQLIRALGVPMARRGWGRIVNISSLYSFLARSGRGAYGASKAALDSLTRTAAVEFGARGVLVNSVLPGFVDTPLTRRNNSPDRLRELAGQIPVGRLGNPEEVAALVAFLVSDENSYITGQSLVIDGGFSIQ